MAMMGIGEWTRGPAIGRGSSATVSLAVDRGSGAVFAVKSVDAARAAELRRERSILLSLASSPHVVRCLGGFGDRDLFLEYAPGGSLADEIKRRFAGGGSGRCEERLVRCRTQDVLLGLAHVHAAGVAHCDVKARNVLVAADGRAVIADFGCARRVADGIGAKRVGGGTPMFMAPEAARGEEQGTAADIWALGCTVLEMATGAAPWAPRFADPMAALRHVALTGEAPECPPWMSADGKDFLARCFRRDPRERWTAEQLLRHPFVAAGNADDDSNSAVPRVAEKQPFVSPKSVLDKEALWDDDDSTASTAATTAAPTDRVRELAAGAPAVPDWTWDANWITVHSGDDEDQRPMTPEPELEADDTTVRHPLARSSAAAASVSGSRPAAAAEEEAVNSTSGNSYGGDAITNLPSAVGSPVTAVAAVITWLPIVTLRLKANGFFHFIGDVPLLLLLLLLLLVPAGPRLRFASHVPFPCPHSLFAINFSFLQTATKNNVRTAR